MTAQPHDREYLTAVNRARDVLDRPGNPDVIRDLIADIGPLGARDLLRDADDQLRAALPPIANKPRPWELVWTDPDGYDHAPVPAVEAMVCGLFVAGIKQPRDLNPPQGTACPECWS